MLIDSIKCDIGISSNSIKSGHVQRWKKIQS